MVPRFVLMFLLLLLFVPGNVCAAASVGNTSAQPAIKLPQLKAEPVKTKAGSLTATELTSMRYAVHTDAVTGTSKLRIVLDLTGPAKASGTIVHSPTPQLHVIVEGTSISTADEVLNLDGTIAEQVTFSNNGKDSLIVVDLPRMVDDSEFKVFTLKKDLKANRPDRVVIDINKIDALPDYTFTAGLKGKVIVLDPGHGGSDPGAIGLGGTKEKDITLSVSWQVQKMLEKAGAKVYMTREDDSDVYGPQATARDELAARAAVANNNKADIFLSIHINSFTKREVGGSSTYYYYKSFYDKLLAQNIQEMLVAEGKLQDRRANAANFYVIRNTVMPAALLELAFISNPNEEKLLCSPDFQQRMARAIVQGIDNFFTAASE